MRAGAGVLVRLRDRDAPKRSRTLFSFPMESERRPACRWMAGAASIEVERRETPGRRWASGLPDGLYYGSVLRGAMAVDSLDSGGCLRRVHLGRCVRDADAGDTWQTLPCRLPRILSVAAYVEA